MSSTKRSEKERRTERILQEADRKSGESVKLADQITEMMIEANYVADDCKQELRDQDLSIQRIRSKVREIDELHDKGDQHLRVIASPSGMAMNELKSAGLFTKLKRSKGPKGSRQNNTIESSENVEKVGDKETGRDCRPPECKVLLPQTQKNLDRVDDSLDQMLKLSADLHRKAVDIGQQIQDSNSDLTGLDEEMNSVQRRTRTNLQKIQNL